MYCITSAGVGHDGYLLASVRVYINERVGGGSVTCSRVSPNASATTVRLMWLKCLFRFFFSSGAATAVSDSICDPRDDEY